MGMKRAFWIMAAMFAVSIGVNVWQCSSHPEASVVVERDTVWRDTVIREPVAAETIQTGRVVYVKVAVAQPQTKHDTIRDSIEVPVPIVQKKYEDSLYTAWISGYRPTLDSIEVRVPEVTRTVTKTIVETAPRVSVGVQVGGGVGVFSRQPDMYVGVGVQLRLWP